MANEADRRIEERIPYRAYATLITGQDQYAAHLLNISSSGALIAVIQDHPLKISDEISLRVETEDLAFCLNGWVAHVRDHYLGIRGRPAKAEEKAQLETFIAKQSERTTKDCASSP